MNAVMLKLEFIEKKKYCCLNLRKFLRKQPNVNQLKPTKMHLALSITSLES